jgi:hypothetical protein
MAEFAIQTMILASRDGNKKFQRCDYTEISSIVVHFFYKKKSHLHPQMCTSAINICSKHLAKIIPVIQKLLVI